MDDISPIQYQTESEEELIVSMTHTNKRLCEKEREDYSYNLSRLQNCLQSIPNPGYPEGLATISFKIAYNSPFSNKNEETAAMFFSNRCNTLGIMTSIEAISLRVSIEKISSDKLGDKEKAQRELIGLAEKLHERSRRLISKPASLVTKPHNF